MALEFYRAGDCSAYDQSVKPARPVLKVRIEAPLSEQQLEVEAPVDTGFSGYLLTPQESYARFSESELPSDYFLTYNTILGRIQLRRAQVFLETFGKRAPGFIETPVSGSGKFLAGRRLISGLRIALLGPEAKSCALEKR